MNNKKLILITSGIVVLSLSAYFIFNPWNKESVTIEEKPGVPKAGVVIPVIEIDEKRKIPVTEEFPSSMEEYGVQEAIHAMSHQKVKAEDKWGFLPMTQVRINRLIEVVEANNYISGIVYLDILNRWLSSDFTRADKDHNVIWDLQEGSIGKASRVLSANEERKFIKEHFKIENE